MIAHPRARPALFVVQTQVHGRDPELLGDPTDSSRGNLHAARVNEDTVDGSPRMGIAQGGQDQRIHRLPPRATRGGRPVEFLPLKTEASVVEEGDRSELTQITQERNVPPDLRDKGEGVDITRPSRHRHVPAAGDAGPNRPNHVRLAIHETTLPRGARVVFATPLVLSV